MYWKEGKSTEKIYRRHRHPFCIFDIVSGKMIHGIPVVGDLDTAEYIRNWSMTLDIKIGDKWEKRMDSAKRKDDTNVLYISDLFGTLWKKKYVILLGALIGAGLLFCYSSFFITPRYKASVTLYANNSVTNEDSSYIAQSDLNASARLVSTYAAIIRSDDVMKSVIDAADLEISADVLAGLLDISAINSTEVFEITIEYTDPDKAAEIVNTLAEIIPERITSIVKGSSVEIINYAKVPTGISYPNYRKMISFGFLGGMVIAVVFLVIAEMMDTRIKTTSDFSRWSYPLLTSVPDFNSNDDYGYGKYGRYGRKSANRAKKKRDLPEENQYILSEDTPFAIQEAYNTLRTNILFSSPDTKKNIIVVTSSLGGEFKSTTAINLAFSLAQNHAKVLLIDCDLRLPTIAEKLNLKASPGLTDLIMDMDVDQKLIYSLNGGVHVMPSGTIPPNPTVMLGSARMQKTLKLLSERYDYIILDTPPLGAMPDAAILSQYATDVVLVVRQNLATGSDIDAVLKKLELAKANILGFVFTCVTADEKRAYRNYNYKYGYSYRRKSKNSSLSHTETHTNRKHR